MVSDLPSRFIMAPFPQRDAIVDAALDAYFAPVRLRAPTLSSANFNSAYRLMSPLPRACDDTGANDVQDTETVTGSGGTVNANPIEVLLEREADGKWRVVQERIIPQAEYDHERRGH